MEDIVVMTEKGLNEFDHHLYGLSARKRIVLNIIRRKPSIKDLYRTFEGLLDLQSIIEDFLNNGFIEIVNQPIELEQKPAENEDLEFVTTLDYLIAILAGGLPVQDAKNRVEKAVNESGYSIRYGIKYLPSEFEKILRTLKGDNSLFVKVATANCLVKLNTMKTNKRKEGD